MAELLAKALEDVKALQSEKEAEERKGPRE
jgi:hypothetical protein